MSLLNVINNDVHDLLNNMLGHGYGINQGILNIHSNSNITNRIVNDNAMFYTDSHPIIYQSRNDNVREQQKGSLNPNYKHYILYDGNGRSGRSGRSGERR